MVVMEWWVTMWWSDHESSVYDEPALLTSKLSIHDLKPYCVLCVMCVSINLGNLISWKSGPYNNVIT